MNWKDRMGKARLSALFYVENLLGVDTVEPWQKEALESISREDVRRMSIRSGHGVGKTTLISWIFLWWITTRAPVRILVTANSESQLRDVTWAEILMWANRLPKEIHGLYDWGLERISLKSNPEECFGSRRTASVDRPEAIQGFHSKHSLVLVEEASGIPDSLFKYMIGALSTPGSKMILAGNPTRRNGYFYDSHMNPRLSELFHKMRVNSEDVPRARAHIEDVIATDGEDSNEYRIRVLGEFPTADDDTVIPYKYCKAAMGRDVEPTETYRVVWGLDVARFGDDRTALAKRMGNVLLEHIKVWRNRDNMEIAGAIRAEYERVKQQEPYYLPSEILIDVIGVGSGVVDRLSEMGLPARGINVGESPSNRGQYVRLRDELWFRAREWLQQANSKIPEDEMFVEELTSPTYSFVSDGRVVVEPKDKMKKRTGRKSPDLADAFVLTFAGGMDVRADEGPYQSGYMKKAMRKAASWMAA